MASKTRKDKMPKRNKRNFRPTEKGAGMTEAGVRAYRRKNPGSKLKTAVTKKKGLTKSARAICTAISSANLTNAMASA